MKQFDIEEIAKMNKGTMIEWMGIEYLEATAGHLKARMPVNERTIQPMGLLHGGATLALAETLGSVGSALLVDLDKFSVVGQQMSANHVRSARDGWVIGDANLLHRGKLTHIWNIDIRDEMGHLISTCRFTNVILSKKTK